MKREGQGFMLRRYKLDATQRMLGSKVPDGASIEIVRFMPRRRVLINYRGEIILTMLWCVPKPDTC
jgi:hypothetical protein